MPKPRAAASRPAAINRACRRAWRRAASMAAIESANQSQSCRQTRVAYKRQCTLWQLLMKREKHRSAAIGEARREAPATKSIVANNDKPKPCHGAWRNLAAGKASPFKMRLAENAGAIIRRIALESEPAMRNKSACWRIRNQRGNVSRLARPRRDA